MFRQAIWKRSLLSCIRLRIEDAVTFRVHLAITNVTTRIDFCHDNRNVRWMSTQQSPANNHDGSVQQQKKIRPDWMDVRRPLKLRVQEFLSSKTVHLADFTCPEAEDMIRGCGKIGSLEGMEMAQDIVDRLMVEKRRVQAFRPDICVPVKFLQVLLYGWATMATKQRVAMTRMKEVLQLAMDESHHDTSVLEKSLKQPVSVEDLHSRPTVDLFNTYLFGLRNASKMTPQAAVDAEATLFQMMEHNKKYGWHCKPNNRCYVNVFSAYANTGHKQAGQRALGLLRKMHHVHDVEKETYEKEYGIPYDIRNPKENKRSIVTPDVIIYTTVMKSLIENNNNEVLDLLKDAQKSETVELDEYFFSTAIKSFSMSIEKERKAPARIELAQRAEEIFSMMVASCENGSFPEPEKDDMSNASKDRNRKQHAIVSAYNAVMDVWSRSYIAEGAPHCEKLFEELLQRNDVSPDVISLNSCLHAWSRSLKFHKDAPKKAEELLKRQWMLVQDGELGEESKPDFRSYTIAILTHAESDDPSKLTYATELLYNLIDRFCKDEIKVTEGQNPVAPFSAVLNVAARTPRAKPGSAEGDEYDIAVDTVNDPYTIANHIYEQIKKDGYNMGTNVDHHAASAFLRVIAKHCPLGSTERDTMSMMVFEEMCQRGEASRLVISAMKDVLRGKTDKFSNIFDKNKRPKDWSRNVPREFL